MITKHEKKVILKCAKKYNALSISLFGSSLEKLFFKFYYGLIKSIVERDGTKIYG